jgi:hypothetical protein
MDSDLRHLEAHHGSCHVKVSKQYRPPDAVLSIITLLMLFASTWTRLPFALPVELGPDEDSLARVFPLESYAVTRIAV